MALLGVPGGGRVTHYGSAFPSSLLEAAFWNPLPSFLPGVDLVPIKPLPNVVTLQEDITTERCRQVIGTFFVPFF